MSHILDLTIVILNVNEKGRFLTLRTRNDSEIRFEMTAKFASKR